MINAKNLRNGIDQIDSAKQNITCNFNLSKKIYFCPFPQMNVKFRVTKFQII